MNPELEPNSNDSDCPQDWRKALINPAELWLRLLELLRDQVPLFEAFWVAVTFHVLLFPVIWFAGWALPWPKSPMMTTVVEINLEHWPNVAKPTKIEDILENELSRAHFRK